jgi:hypothetical protein
MPRPREAESEAGIEIVELPSRIISFIGERRSSIVVRLIDSLKKSKPDIREEYDLASLGEVGSISGPFDDPPRWTVSYKERVLAKAGDRINQKLKREVNLSRKKGSLVDPNGVVGT